MANPAVLAQLQQLVGHSNALQQTIGDLQTSNNTLTTRIPTLEAENTTLTTANTTLTAQVQNLPRGAAAGGTARGGAGATTPVPFAATPAMVNHQDLINYSTEVGTMIYNEGCKKLTTEFDMKLSGTVVFTTELQAKCIKMGWHMGAQQIINFTNVAGSTINIVHQYGQIDMVALQTQCEVFCKNTGTLFQARARQNNHHEDAYPCSQSQTLTFLRGLRDQQRHLRTAPPQEDHGPGHNQLRCHHQDPAL